MSSNKTVNEVIRHVQLAPDIARTVVGGEEYGGSPVLHIHDAQSLAVLQDILTQLKKIEYHLHCMTDADLDQGNL